MNAAEIIKEAAAAGILIAIEGDGLSLEATAKPPKAIIELITQHKLEIINLLRSGPGRLAEARISWLDMEVAVENEVGRHRIWRDELTRQAADDKLTAAKEAQQGSFSNCSIVVWRNKLERWQCAIMEPCSRDCLACGSASCDISCARPWPLASLFPSASTNRS